MRNIWRTVLSMTLATSMAASSVPVTAQTVVGTERNEKGITSQFESLKKKNLTTADKTNIAEQVETMKKSTRQYIEGEAIVLYQGSSAKVKSFSDKSGFGKEIEIVSSYEFSNEGTVNKKSGMTSQPITVSLVKSETYSTEELISKLKQRADVTYVEPNYRIKATEVDQDPYEKYQWALDNTGQNAGTVGADINADTAVLQEDADDTERVIAIVDTGIDYTHEDLQDVVWNNPFADTKKLKGQHGYDFYNYDDDPMDDNGHGTHCSGIMAGTSDNGVGIAGAANSENIKIMGLKFLDEDGWGDDFGAIGAYNYIYKAQQLGINVVAVNNSWGGVGESEILETLINMVGEQGALSICAAGNDSVDNDIYETLPASLDSPYIISVAASNEKDELAEFSSYGADSVDIAAPGVDILSSVTTDTFNPGIYENKEELCLLYEDFSKASLVSSGAIGVTSGPAIDADEIAYGLDVVGDESKVSVSLDDTVYFGEKETDAKSLKWEIKDAKEGEMYYLNLPYNSKKSKTAVYDSMMLRMEAPEFDFENWDFSSFPSEFYICDNVLTEDGAYIERTETVLGGTLIYNQNNYWDHISVKRASSVAKEENRAVSLQLYVSTDGDYTIYLDDLGISQSDIDSKEFGKYDFYNGTSMATPYLTGTVAAVANAYPDETAEEIKARVLGSTRISEDLEGKVATNGVLDLSKVENPNPYINSIQFDQESKEIEINGNFLERANVKINGKTVNAVDKTNKAIVLDGEDLANKKLDIEISKDDYTVTKTYFFSAGKDFERKGVMEDIFFGGKVTTDGEKFYYVNEFGAVAYYDPNAPKTEENNNNSEEGNGEYDFGDYAKAKLGVKSVDDILGNDVINEDEFEGDNSETEDLNWEIVGDGFNIPIIFGSQYDYTVDYDLSLSSDVITCNKKLWTIVNLNVGYAEETALVCFDPEFGTWVKAGELPEGYDELLAPTLTAYNGRIYFLGGLDLKTGEASKKVICYNEEKEEWKVSVDMPEGRIASKALQVGEKLVVTLGSSETEECAANLIFDGQKWTKSKAKLDVVSNADSYYDVQVGIIDGGIIYTNCLVENLGDTFVYHIEEDSFKSTGYSLHLGLKPERVLATTIGDNFYALYENRVVESGSYYDEELDEVIKYYESYATLGTIPVESACITIEDISAENGYVLGTGSYLPGDTVVLSPMAEENFFVKQFIVDGTEVEGENYRFRATKDKNGLQVSVVTGAYVSGLEIYPVDKPAVVDLEVIKHEQFEVNILPENADNEEVIWESSDETIATVDQNGKVTYNMDKTGEAVEITATAADRGVVSATYTLTVPAKPEPTVNPTSVPTAKPTAPPVATEKPVTQTKVKRIKLAASKKTVKAGKKVKINATVLPAKATNKKLTWKTSNKKYATVNKNGVVTTKKAGKGKTVTITATAKDGSKVKKNYKIKIK